MVLKQQVMDELKDYLDTDSHFVILNDGETYTGLEGCVLAYRVTHPVLGYRYYDLEQLIEHLDKHPDPVLESFEIK